MGMEGAKIVIVDDIPAEGQQILEALWEANYPAMFFRFNQDILQKLKERGAPMKGVRAVFMDMDLLGSGLKGDGKAMFSTIQSVLETILHTDNGPYTLITWTQFDQYSEDLYAFLRERIKERGRSPTALVRLNKKEFRAGDPRGLAEKVQTSLGQHNSLACLSSWELAVNTGASDIVNNLANVAGQGVQTGDEFEARLALLLRKISAAEAGKEIERSGNITPHMNSVLSQLIDDVAGQIALQPYDPDHPAGRAQIGEAEMDVWRRQVNSMLNYEKQPKPSVQPGSIFRYPDSQAAADQLKLPGWREQQTVIRGHFFRNEPESRRKSEEIQKREEASRRASLVLVDITPPCDHAQNKVVWRAYVVAAKLPLDCQSYIWRWPENQQAPEKGRLWADYLWMSPEFKVEENMFSLLFNSRMIFTIDKQPAVLERLGNAEGRIREILLADLLGWIGRQISRVGHVAL